MWSWVTSFKSVISSSEPTTFTDEELFGVAFVSVAVCTFLYFFVAKEIIPFVKKSDKIIPEQVNSWDSFFNKEVPMLYKFVKKVAVKLHEAHYFLPQLKEYFSSFFW
jgi:hypothetical protein